MNLALKYEMGRNYFLKQVRSRVMKQTEGVYPAPLKIIDVCCLCDTSELSVKFCYLWHDIDQYVDQRGLGEKLCEKIVKHVN